MPSCLSIKWIASLQRLVFLRSATIFSSNSFGIFPGFVFGSDERVKIGTSPTFLASLTHRITAVWWKPKYLPTFLALQPLKTNRAASLLILGMRVFVVYGMTLMISHQSGAKLVEDYVILDIYLVYDIMPAIGFIRLNL